ncbi:transcriptional regulator [Actinacidiphila soli]|uniref:transcriptional regulator n=1 Tax=Actinacidiphila soli TaxID=2487275 RepID=UPI000FC9DBFF|nr:transcriptional regulator [Actinacidiphila soli]
MLTSPSETMACPDTARWHRLAAQLADMIPEAATIRVSLTDPKQAWPHPHAIAKNAAGESITLSRTTARVAARWILRVWADADWTLPHTFDLATATLIRSDLAAGRGR